jgi:hypothetical protein
MISCRSKIETRKPQAEKPAPEGALSICDYGMPEGMP